MGNLRVHKYYLIPVVGVSVSRKFVPAKDVQSTVAGSYELLGDFAGLIDGVPVWPITEKVLVGMTDESVSFLIQENAQLRQDIVELEEKISTMEPVEEKILKLTPWR